MSERDADDSQDLSPYQPAFDELASFFDDSAEATGLCGINYGAGSGGVFDAYASARAHMRRRAPAVRNAVQKRSRTLTTLLTLPSYDQLVLTLGFTPRRWEWTDVRSLSRRKEPSACESAVRKAFRIWDVPIVCVLAMALETDAARRLFLADEAARAELARQWSSEPTKLDLLAYLELQALAGNTKTIEPVKSEATRLLLQSVDAYIEACQARDDALGDIRREEAARARARARIKVLRGEGGRADA